MALQKTRRTEHLQECKIRVRLTVWRAHSSQRLGGLIVPWSEVSWVYPAPHALQGRVIKGCLRCVTITACRHADIKWKYNIYYCTLSMKRCFPSHLSSLCSPNIQALVGQWGYVWSTKLPNASKNISKGSPEALFWSWCHSGTLLID